ncbi:hypothetical protein ACROYT_G008952 [Oculina patagonica]
MKLFLLSILSVLIPSSHSQFNTLDAIKVRSDISLPGRVLTNEDALKLLQRQAEVIYQVNLPQYLEELRKTNAELKPDFTDQSFTVVGSLATLDAAITFAEGVENVNVIRSDNAAGFTAKPNPTNDKVHTGVQRLNAARNILWLLKEKLKSGVVSTDASLMDKLREAQTWLSTQTGGHLGQGMTFALEKAGVMQKLQAKWGPNSVKFQSFSAAAGNGLDFLINGYNTVVNSLALSQEVSTANILAVTSSVTAMAGDVTMGVAQVLSTRVASGLTGQENLEAKDYVKAFLGPLIPDPTFGTTVEMIDQIAKGNVLEFYHLYLSQSLPAALAIGGMAVIDRLTGSSSLAEYLQGIKILGLIIYQKRAIEFREEVAKNTASTVRELKPKQLLYSFPHPVNRDRYLVEGWKSEGDIKEQFQISSELANVRLFMATYNNDFAKPFACPDKAQQGFTFCPEAAPHGDDKLIFMGSMSVNEKVLLDDNCEAYGMGGNDHFVLKAGGVVRKGVKINGGDGSDIIDITNTFFGSRSSVTGGGPERDVIKTGPGDDTIVVDNDEVEITNGDNTLIVEGKGNDEIRVGTGADLVLVEKSGGSIVLRRVIGSNENPGQNKLKRIVYKGEERVKEVSANSNDLIRGGPTQFDLLTMRKYNPNMQTQGEERILLIEETKNIDEFMQEISEIRSIFLRGHEFEVTPNGDMRTKAQRIEVSDIERFEMSENTINMLLLKRGTSDYYEVTGGPKHDFVINLDRAKPLLAQMSTGDNRVLSGKGKDSYSVILDAGDDVIYDKGGENILAVLLPQGTTLNDATIGRSGNGQGYKIERKTRPRDHRIEFIFLGGESVDDNVQIIVQDSTGKQITFKPVPQPSLADDFFSQDRSVGSYYYDKFEFCPGDQDVIAIVEGIAPPIGETLAPPQC